MYQNLWQDGENGRNYDHGRNVVKRGPIRQGNGNQDEDGQDENDQDEDDVTAVSDHDFRPRLAENEEAENYIKLIMDLQPYVDKINLPVPIIVVFGDQSAGKSALIRRLSNNFPIPRGAGRCTTGPIEIHMIKSQTVKERSITLRFVGIPDFPFCDITGRDPAEIEALLTDCQVLVRNPTQALDVIHRNNSNMESQLRQLASRIRQQKTDEFKFTNNVICIKIKGPMQHFSLALVDLPGLVSDIREDEVAVKEMVRHYIQKKNTILLPIFNINNDIHNQSAWQLLKEEKADKEGQRTVGVLSRADELTTSKTISEKWAALFRGEAEHKLSHGFYLIKNPSNEESERRADPDQLEMETTENLLCRSEWNGVPRERMGLPNLVKTLSKLQIKSLQDVQKDVISRLDVERNKLRAELATIRPPEGDPISAFIESIDKFCIEFRDHANTDSLEASLYQGQLWNLGQYDLAISNTCPLFNLHGVNKEDGLVFDPVQLGALQPALFAKRKDELIAEDWGNDAVERKTWSAEEIRDVLINLQAGQVIGYFPYKTVVAIVKQHTNNWNDYAKMLLDKDFQWVSYFVSNLAAQAFGSYSSRVIDEIQKVLKNLLRKCHDVTNTHINDYHNMERVSASRILFVADEAKYLRKMGKYFYEIRIRAIKTNGDDGDAQLFDVIGKGSDLIDIMFGKKQSTPEKFNSLKDGLLTDLGVLTDPKDHATTTLVTIVSNWALPDNGQSTSPSTQEMFGHKIRFVSYILEATMPKKTGLPTANESSPDGHGHSAMNLNMRLNQKIHAQTHSEQVYLAAAGSLTYWKMLHERFRESIPRIVEYYLVHGFSRQLRSCLMRHFDLQYRSQSDSSKASYNKEFDDEPLDSQDVQEMLLEPVEVKVRRNQLQEELNNLNRVISEMRALSRM